MIHSPVFTRKMRLRAPVESHVGCCSLSVLFVELLKRCDESAESLVAMRLGHGVDSVLGLLEAEERDRVAAVSCR